MRRIANHDNISLMRSFYTPIAAVPPRLASMAYPLIYPPLLFSFFKKKSTSRGSQYVTRGRGACRHTTNECMINQAPCDVPTPVEATMGIWPSQGSLLHPRGLFRITPTLVRVSYYAEGSEDEGEGVFFLLSFPPPPPIFWFLGAFLGGAT